MRPQPTEGSQQQQYDDLKKKLLSEYKKMQKKGQPSPNMVAPPKNKSPATNQ